LILLYYISSEFYSLYMPYNNVLAGKYKIAFLICYFGELPWYIDLFLKSCEYNLGFDFFIIGDLLIDKKLPSNVFLKRINLSELQTLASKKLHIPVNISNPYKLCDLKPAYGEIFSDMLIKYDFWGHCDLDILFGDIKEFITDDILNYYDIICVREEYVTGFFTLYRNKSRINRLFLLSKDYKFVFSSPKHYCFDECNFAWIDLMNGMSIFDVKTEIESMTHIIKRLNYEGKINAHFNFVIIEGICGNLEWNNGHLYYANKVEALLYHMIQFKKQSDLIKPNWLIIPNIFYIERNYLLRNHPDSAAGRREVKSIPFSLSKN
jgi:hypothetical protein